MVWGEGFVRPLLRDRYSVSRRPSVGVRALGREGANREGGRARHAPGARLYGARFPSVCHKHSEVSSLSQLVAVPRGRSLIVGVCVVRAASGPPSSGPSGILAEIASCQLEWTYLAHVTGSKVHFDKVGMEAWL